MQYKQILSGNKFPHKNPEPIVQLIAQQPKDYEQNKKQAETLTNTHAGVSGNKFPQTKPERTRQKIDRYQNRDAGVSDKKLTQTKPRTYCAIASDKKLTQPRCGSSGFLR